MTIEWFALGFSIFALVVNISVWQLEKYIDRANWAALRGENNG